MDSYWLFFPPFRFLLLHIVVNISSIHLINIVSKHWSWVFSRKNMKIWLMAYSNGHLQQMQVIELCINGSNSSKQLWNDSKVAILITRDPSLGYNIFTYSKTRSIFYPCSANGILKLLFTYPSSIWWQQLLVLLTKALSNMKSITLKFKLTEESQKDFRQSLQIVEHPKKAPHCVYLKFQNLIQLLILPLVLHRL